MALLRCLPWLAVLLVQVVHGQDSEDLPNSFPHAYPGQPSGDLSQAWQNYFEVDSQQLPNISFALPRSFAGNIPVDRPNHPNNTLFFWALEKSNGSLTANSSSDPWLLWLQGGPGSSSLAGMLFENGPFRLQPDFSMKENNFSYDRLVDSVWLDQPVGTGYSTSDKTGYVADDDQAAEDLVRFLANLVKVFPSLGTRPLYLAGESYAGRWIPYTAKALFSMENPPVKLAKLAMGNPSIGSFAAGGDLAVAQVIETFPQLVSYDPQILEYFRTQRHLCGYDLNLTYPQQGGHFPTLARPSAVDPASPWFYTGSTSPFYFSQNFKYRAEAKFLALAKVGKSIFIRDTLKKRYLEGTRVGLSKRDVEREMKREVYKRDLSLRANDTIDPWYACNLLEEMYDYAVNFTFPWDTGADEEALNVYDGMDVTNPKPLNSVVSGATPPFFSDNRTRAAIHAPTSKDWSVSFPYPFINTLDFGDPSPDSQDFLDELATNASQHGVGIVFYSGNNDMLLPHLGTLVAIQNTTFGGIQGFSQKPATAWFNDDGSFAGVIHQERNWTFAIFQDASHLVPNTKPAAAYVFLRDFILGSKTTGLVTTSPDGSVTVDGGTETSLTGIVLPPETAAVYYGSAATQSTLTYPAETVAAWNSAIAQLNQLDAQTTQSNGAATATSCLSNFFMISMGTLLGMYSWIH